MNASDRDVVEDGFGGRWVKHGPDCDLQVVRPGKVQCSCPPERTPQDDTTPIAEGSYEWYRREVERLRGQLGEASDALHTVGKAALTVAPRLREPYRDAPETSPWTQFMEQPARRAYNLGVRIRRELKDDLEAEHPAYRKERS